MTQPTASSSSQHLVPVTVQAVASTPQKQAFDSAVGVDLSKIFKQLGPIPAVVSTKEQTAPWNQVGASRKPQLSDGTAAYEQITAYVPSFYFEYEVSRFTNLFRLLVTGARGDWKFTPATEGGTTITWTYAFRPLRFRKLAVRVLVAPLWRRYMKRALAATVIEVERGNA